MMHNKKQSSSPQKIDIKREIYKMSKKRCTSDIPQPYMNSIRITTKNVSKCAANINKMKIFSPKNHQPQETHWMNKICSLADNDFLSVSIGHPLVTLKKQSKKSSDSDNIDKCKTDDDSNKKIPYVETKISTNERDSQVKYDTSKRIKLFKTRENSKVFSDQDFSNLITQDNQQELVEENKRLKTENLRLIKKINQLEELLKVKELVWKKEYEDEKFQKAEAKSHYHDGLRHQIHIKFKKKVEQQELRHLSDINLLKEDFTNQIETLHEIIGEMGETINKFRDEDLNQLRRLHDIIMERDIKIEELESKINDYNATLKDASNYRVDESNYSLNACNNACRENQKQKDREVCLLQEENRELRSLIDLENGISGSLSDFDR